MGVENILNNGLSVRSDNTSKRFRHPSVLSASVWVKRRLADNPKGVAQQEARTKLTRDGVRQNESPSVGLSMPLRSGTGRISERGKR